VTPSSVVGFREAWALILFLERRAVPTLFALYFLLAFC